VISLADLLTSDNDLLSGMVAIAAKADRLIILTNQTGLFTADPNLDKNAKLVEEVKNVDFEFERLCSNTKSTPGRGGMLSKIRAAKHAANAGMETYIIDGRVEGLMLKAAKGVQVGTKVLASGSKEITEQKRWLLAAKGFGQVIVDDGAVKALRSSKSLLLPGIVSMRGYFGKNEIVEVINKTGVAVAYGKINYDQTVLSEALANKKNDSATKLEKPVIHYDHMAVIKA
jgi:glutamate 5-kinase